MALRIVYSFVFIARWQDDKKLQASKNDECVSFWSILPSVPVLVALVCALVGGLLSAQHAPNAFVHIAAGGALFCALAFTAFVHGSRPGKRQQETTKQNCTGGGPSEREWVWQIWLASSRNSDAVRRSKAREQQAQENVSKAHHNTAAPRLHVPPPTKAASTCFCVVYGLGFHIINQLTATEQCQHQYEESCNV